MKKRVLAVFMMLVLGASLIACAKKTPAEEPKEETVVETKEEVALTVFAAASMTETLQDIAELYKDEAPHVSLSFNFDSSGTLQTQIEEGADCDVFISAGEKQVNELEEGEYLVKDSRFDLLLNKVTLCVPTDNPKEINSFEDLVSKLPSEEMLFAMGNSDVPVGQYTQKIFEHFQLDEAVLAESGKISYGSNVKEVTTWVSEGSVDAGVVYCTDAFSAGLEIVDEATEEMCGKVLYPAAVVKATENEEEAKAYLEFLQSDQAVEIFEKVGFTKAF
ncbi:molybdate transport system substrate-binding protein [Aequitasia blattaphilus]|uniref:Molybdate ABC transporter substrate-binding protein n=1 Tax=Aequitasia blattaphilus TaxID=2949332 RepID=A0ABT1EB62_9FIRM|nr:molybdate ABC transporter substrate-binding protein [Aequitasia blattaphilus]MCP1102096.1 molybdate ABC transporter substrate-binding protein [Aequitasia blattaphilus]MCR8614736.1 molybdate ABC transporter substrate-binding protein [Aequitasia blattaphilus]